MTTFLIDLSMFLKIFWDESENWPKKKKDGWMDGQTEGREEEYFSREFTTASRRLVWIAFGRPPPSIYVMTGAREREMSERRRGGEVER